MAQRHKVCLLTRLVVGSIPTLGIKYLFKFIIIFLLFGVEVNRGIKAATQRAMPPEFANNRLNTRCGMPILLCAG